MKVLVTGGCGFIGSHLVDACISDGCEVVVIDNLLTGKLENLNEKAVLYQEDIRNLSKIKELFNGADIVFHVAALPRVPLSIEDPLLTHEINVNGTLNVLIASRDAGVKRFVYSSSSSVYGHQTCVRVGEGLASKPLNPYGLQKCVGEEYCRVFSDVYGLRTVSLRYFNVYGQRQSSESRYCAVIPLFIENIVHNRVLHVYGDGNQTRDFTHVRDVVVANIQAAMLDSSIKHLVCNIGSGNSYTINQLISVLTRNHKNIVTEYKESRVGEIKMIEADNSRAKELLNWRPKSNLDEEVTGLLELRMSSISPE